MLALASLVLTACTGVPAGIEPVQQFELNRYLGKWYEIARLDHSFEEGLEQVTAEYSLRDGGGINVVNKGFSTEDNEWSVADGKAFFVRGEDEGYFKVSFFGPFYGSYVIFEMDQDQYSYAFVTSHNKSYLWLLSRTPTVSDDLKKRFVDQSRSLGYDVDALIWVKQQ